MTELPPPARTGAPYRIGLICLGNICRSPTADVVLSDLVERAGLADRVRVRSGGTGGWHVGGAMDRRAAAALSGVGLDPTRHRAQQVDGSWFAGDLGDDLLLAMDGDNLAALRSIAPEGYDGSRLRLFRDFDPEGTGDVPDPYYGGADGFDDVLAMVLRTSRHLVEELTVLRHR